uniref:Uncharacterized protein n=1 Tax=Romanomermis culicivorax TaxID=13658 RepID=A0A915KWY2_ROMCU
MGVRPASSLPLSGSGPGTDPPGLQEKAEYLLREWVGMQHNPATAKDPSKAFSAIVSQYTKQ